jgi:hypothetical protein
MAVKKKETEPTNTRPPVKKPKDGDAPVRTQMQGEHGDDDLGYDPSAIPVEDIPED